MLQTLLPLLFHSRPLEDEKSSGIHLEPRRRGGSNSDARQSKVPCTPTMSGHGGREDGAWVGGLEQDLFIKRPVIPLYGVIRVVFCGNCSKKHIQYSILSTNCLSLHVYRRGEREHSSMGSVTQEGVTLYVSSTIEILLCYLTSKFLSLASERSSNLQRAMSYMKSISRSKRKSCVSPFLSDIHTDAAHFIFRDSLLRRLYIT